MLLHQKRVGALLRCFAREESLVPKAVEQALTSIEKMLSVKVAGQPFIRQVEVLVPMDTRYTDCDYGGTAERLRKEVHARGWKSVTIHEVKNGDVFVVVLNYGMAKLLRAGCDYGLVLSKEAEEYLTPEACEDIVTALSRGAKVVGIAISELTESIMQGRIANTFAVWDLMALAQVGLFDGRNAKLMKDTPVPTRAEAWDQKKGFWVYDWNGVEEIIPLIRLVRMFGECLATILPRGIAMWKAPDPVTDPAGYERHVNKLGTKFVRQSHYADLERTDLSFLIGGVMPDYRHSDYIQ